MSKDYASRRQQRRTRARAGVRLIWFVLGFFFGYLTAAFFDFNSLRTWLGHRVANEGSQVGKSDSSKADKKEIAAVKPKFEFYTLLSKDGTESQAREEIRLQVRQEILASKAAEASKEVPSTIDAMPTPSSPTQTVPVNANAIAPAHVDRTSEKANQLVIHEKKPALATASTQVTASAMKASLQLTKQNKPSQNFVIQIAAFNKAKDAERLKAILALTGFNASITTIQRQSIMWFRVSVGPFASLDEAKKAQVSVYKVEHMRGIIRQA